MGDGQQLSLRAQAGNNYQNYSISFVEPWLRGSKTPTSFSTSLFYSRFTQNNSEGNAVLDIFGSSVGLIKRLKWPDTFFRLSHAISYQNYNFVPPD